MKFTSAPFAKKGKSLLAGAFALAATALGGVPAHAAANVGEVLFVGDSITQADGRNAVSYRYALWKHFVDSGVAYSPLGSMNFYCRDGRPTTSPLAPDYLGKKFDNTNEGHFGWDVAWLGDGAGGRNRANTWSVEGGLASWMSKYGRAPKTATLLMGVNDLSRGSGGKPQYSTETVLANAKSVVRTIQEKSPRGVTVHVFSVLPSGQPSWGSGRGVPRAAIAEYDAMLKRDVESGAWNFKKSKVFYHDVTAGFDPVAHTYDNLHPKAQGERVVAAHMARALGLDQRTAGLARRGNAELPARATPGKASAERRVEWKGAKKGAAHEFTLALTVKLNASKTPAKNVLGVLVGNGGGETGMLCIGESGVFWGGVAPANLLYGQTNDAYKDKFMTKGKKTLRVAWIAERRNGAASGFYVWLDDVLIGEALRGDAGADKCADGALSGPAGGDFAPSGEISEIAFDPAKAWAPAR
ncbi:MAG: GDSL-type esterase/lipase family protein [Candidatus Spyradosoma sp.]